MRQNISLNQDTILGGLATSFWYAYLLMLLVMSFNPNRIDSGFWQGFLAFFYLFLAIYLVAVLFGMRCHTRAMHNARLLLIFSFSTLVWLFVQANYSAQYRPLSAGLASANIPAWFSPDTRISITPGKTLWLGLENQTALLGLVNQTEFVDLTNVWQIRKRSRIPDNCLEFQTEKNWSGKPD